MGQELRFGQHVEPLYHIYGAMCAEVELDALTGNYIIPRCDMLLDAGQRYVMSNSHHKLSNRATAALDCLH